VLVAGGLMGTGFITIGFSSFLILIGFGVGDFFFGSLGFLSSSIGTVNFIESSYSFG